MAVSELLLQFQDLHLSEKTAVSLETVEETYVLDIAAQPSSKERALLAATSSNNTIRLFSLHNLAAVATITGHSDVVTGICFGKQEPDLLYSSSIDNTVRCWDTRTDMKKAVQIFEGSDESNNVFISMDVNASDAIVCAGLELDKDKNAFILFWDRRNTDLMGCYRESHQDDITQVCFHPTDSDSLATGSTDGLVCVFDISQTCEDDALISTFNSLSSVGRVGWCGQDYKDVYCCTHIDTYHVWDAQEGDQVLEILDLKERLQGKDKCDYLVDCLATEGGETFLVTGTHGGGIGVVNVGPEKPVAMATRLEGGHNSTVRCSIWNRQLGSLVTGAEDSLLCLWSKDPSSGTKLKESQVKLKATKSVAKKTATKRKKPY